MSDLGNTWIIIPQISQFLRLLTMDYSVKMRIWSLVKHVLGCNTSRMHEKLIRQVDETFNIKLPSSTGDFTLV